MDNPEFISLRHAARKLELDSKYNALFKTMGLSSADLDKFKDSLVERQEVNDDIMGAVRAQGLNSRNTSDHLHIYALLLNAQSQAETAFQQTLGSDHYAQYQQYELTMPQRDVVSQLSQNLTYSDTPLQGSQSEGLLNILSSASSTGGSTGLITDAVLTQAQAILTPQQMTALQQLQAQQKIQQRIAQLIQVNSNTPATPATHDQGGLPAAGGVFQP
jgi:hypothetical protein